jgi:hypothetical protein
LPEPRNFARVQHLPEPRNVQGLVHLPESAVNGGGPLEQTVRRMILLARRVDQAKQAYDEAAAAWERELQQLRV